ncbi:MAG: hypothetical protein A2665_01920 [Candidatus Zambryskibacteria bacterium RIFCSPHIGHO2_01_FULL_46_30]|uniref:ATP-grasp domain-containing protein n=1 Tax=Candidatus Zambryskibacteria bacterium RIFCSPHIGHO2_01_FULL_46_30 TaxID=1802739 RepID=A0A1G2T325_9BACT|nr:MAG: D-alanine-D-alanine ligase [Parcubacteria group bacterium GW2011_GWB1_49_7]OHA91686.1 MAG: hypothetical protein A2665_01920 [Candidatus Zambryskibacteria bacterium RIFCSPHIGHO2_01_FULL_46_30]OHB06662.1 MAG: hypothetical protein A3B22_00915 [Candidatus Zambryskibacteria bacterium RIFCSPLOWO2_01_FULL_47_33]
MTLSSKIRVAVLRGGPSSGYESSLKTGEHILSTLRDMSEVYEPVDILISKDGEWHRGGLAYEPHRALEHSDVVWNALHGSYGEDGQVQRLLEGLQIPFTGSSAVASVFAMDKDMAKVLYCQHGLLSPESSIITEEDFDDNRLIHIFRTYLHPVVVKPALGTASLGIRLAHTFQELKEAVKATFSHSRKALVEEHVQGAEASCVVIEKAKGEKLYALIPTGQNTTEQNKRIEEMSRIAHGALGMRHYSNSDFILTPKGKIYILETNALPVFHKDSLLNQSLHATGWRSRDFIDHVIRLAM